jgi:hypothetical protein
MKATNQISFMIAGTVAIEVRLDTRLAEAQYCPLGARVAIPGVGRW